MEAVYGFPVLGPLGVNAMPVRTPIRRLLLCNRQVSPGLGEEGVFLAARAAADLIKKSDSSRSQMRRGLWGRAEL